MARYTPVTNWDDVPIIMDLKMAARIVGQSDESLKKRSQAGTFPAYKLGKEWRVDKADLQEYLTAQKRAAGWVTPIESLRGAVS